MRIFIIYRPGSTCHITNPKIQGQNPGVFELSNIVFCHSKQHVHSRRPLTRNCAYAPWRRAGVDTGERQQGGRAKLKASAAKEESSGGSGDHILQSPRFRTLGFAREGRDRDTRRVRETSGYDQKTIPIALLLRTSRRQIDNLPDDGFTLGSKTKATPNWAILFVKNKIFDPLNLYLEFLCSSSWILV